MAKQSPENWNTTQVDPEGSSNPESATQTMASVAVTYCCGPSDDTPTPVPEDRETSDPLEFGV